LGGLVTAAKQDDGPTLYEIDPVSWAVMYPELTNTLADRRCVTQIARLHSDDARIDAKSSLIVPEAIEPIGEGL